MAAGRTVIVSPTKTVTEAPHAGRSFQPEDTTDVIFLRLLKVIAAHALATDQVAGHAPAGTQGAAVKYLIEVFNDAP